MPFQSIEPRRLYRQIADQIRTLIRSGEFPAGSRLPPERDLAKQLGVSRPSVREALIALEVEGLVKRFASVPGSTCSPAGDGGGRAQGTHEAEAGPFELLRARYVIEAECAALAAKSAKKAQLQAIADALDDDAAREGSGEHQPLGADRLFHMRIAEAPATARGGGGQNPVGGAHGALYKQLEDHYDAPALWEAAMAEHRAVLKAMRRRSQWRAGAMQRHLNRRTSDFRRIRS